MGGGKDPFSFSQFRQQRELDKLKKKGRGEGSETDLPKPEPGKARKIFRPSVSRKPDPPK